jgi:hypothetical protein
LSRTAAIICMPSCPDAAIFSRTARAAAALSRRFAGSAGFAECAGLQPACL